MADVTLYSPLTHSSFSKSANRALLLQFTLVELCRIYNAVDSDEVFRTPSYSPLFDSSVGHWHKLREHALFYASAFSSTVADSLMEFIKQMNEVNFQIQSKKLFAMLEPLIEKYKDDESLIYFILRHQENIGRLLHPLSLKNFLIKLHPSGIEKLRESICKRYEEKGFTSLLPQLARLFSYV